MSKLQVWILSMIAKSIVLQGNHKSRIVRFYQVLIQEARKEFNEDNISTLNAFLVECHDEALYSTGYPPLR